MLRCRAFINLISRRSVAINETNSQSIKPESLRPDSSFPEAPAIESCCGSGCQNCVWIEYANSVHKYFEDHPEVERTLSKWKTVEDLLRTNVKDPNLRVYLEMELKSKFFR